MALGLVLPADGMSIITISGSDGDPAWTRRLRWPGAGDDHVTLAGADRRLWASRLDAAVLRAERPALLVAEGIGCFAASCWARLSPSHYVSRVAGAVLFDPRRAEDGRFASPASDLPFPTVVVGADRARDDLSAALGDRWGSHYVDAARERLAPVGWVAARRLMLRLTQRVVDHDLDQAAALRGLTPVA